MQYGLVIDLLKCVGCNACGVACKSEYGTPLGVFYNKVKLTEIGQYPEAKLKNLPISCMHCKNPRCIKVCPTEATFQREDGIVLIDREICIGCGACVVACPYGSRTLIREIQTCYENEEPTPYERQKSKIFKAGTAVKCNFCKDRLTKGRLPACVETCPALARTFGDLDDPGSEVSKLLKIHKGIRVKDEDETAPSVFYIRV